MKKTEDAKLENAKLLECLNGAVVVKVNHPHAFPYYFDSVTLQTGTGDKYVIVQASDHVGLACKKQ